MKRWGPLSPLVALFQNPQQDVPDKLVVISSNLGNGGYRNIAANLYGWQEGGDRAPYFDRARKDGTSVYRPDAPPGAASTPVGWRLLREPHPFAYPLYPGGDIGPGTGPDNGKAKCLVGVRFNFGGFPGAFGNMHSYAGQRGHNKRALVSRTMVSRAERILSSMDGFKILSLDANTSPHGWSVEPLRDRGWKTMQIGAKQVTTHGAAWSPDQIWYKPAPGMEMIPEDQYTYGIGSDHKALVNVFGIRKA